MNYLTVLPSFNPGKSEVVRLRSNKVDSDMWRGVLDITTMMCVCYLQYILMISLDIHFILVSYT